MRNVLFILAMLLLPSMAGAQAGTRVLFVPGGSLPRHMRGPVRGLLASRAVLISTDTYTRAAERRNVRASSPRGVRTVGVRQGADVIVVVTYGGHFRRRVLRARFFGGRSGELITSGTYRTRGRRLRPAAQHALLRDLEQAASASGPRGAAPAASIAPFPTEEPPAEEPPAEEPPAEEPPPWEPPPETGAGSELPPPLSWDSPPSEDDAGETPEPESVPEAPEAETGEDVEATPLQDQRVWGFSLGAGIGGGQRGNTIPLDGAEATLSSTAYPSIQIGALGHLRPDPSSRFRVEVSARYTASVGLSAEDRPADGTTQTTDMHAHHFVFDVMARLPLAPGEHMTELLLGARGGFEVLETDADVSIPNYTIGGIYARVGFNFYIGDSPISIAVIPEVGHAVSLSDQLSETAQVSGGVGVGAEGVVRLQVVDEVSMSLMYRESHTFLSSERGTEMHDVARYGVLGVHYEY